MCAVFSDESCIFISFVSAECTVEINLANYLPDYIKLSNILYLRWVITHDIHLLSLNTNFPELFINLFLPIKENETVYFLQLHYFI